MPQSERNAEKCETRAARLDLNRRDDVKDVARATLVNRREHLALFDRAFDLFWRQHVAAERLHSDSWGQIDRQERSRNRVGFFEAAEASALADKLDPSIETLLHDILTPF